MKQKRPLIVTLAAVLQSTIAAVVLLVWTAWALWGSSLLASILLATVFCGVPLLLSVVAARGLWSGSPMGWWIAVALDLTGLVLVAWNLLRHAFDFQNVSLCVLLGVTIVLLLLPRTRHYCDVPHKSAKLFEA